MNIKEINEITGRILTLESKCEQYEYYIQQIDSDITKLLESDLTVSVNSKRSQVRISLSAEETIRVLSKRLEMYKSELAQLKEKKFH